MRLCPGTREPAVQREGFMSEWHRTRARERSPYAFSRWIKSSTEPLGWLEEAPLQAWYFKRPLPHYTTAACINSKGLVFTALSGNISHKESYVIFSLLTYMQTDQIVLFGALKRLFHLLCATPNDWAQERLSSRNLPCTDCENTDLFWEHNEMLTYFFLYRCV